MNILRVFAACLLAFGGVTGNAQAGASSAASVPESNASSATAKPVSFSLAANYGKLPLSFEANQGQTDPQVKFLSRGKGYSLFLTDSAAVLALTKGDPATTRRPRLDGFEKNPATVAKPAKTDVVRMELTGASHGMTVSGAEQLPGTANYFIGNDTAKWHSNVPTYAKVKYSSVYPGVDLVYYGNQRRLEYDFVVAPGADSKQIRLHFAGARKLNLDRNGDLEVTTKSGEIAFQKPVTYQMKDGQSERVEGRFLLHRGNHVGFALGAYDHTRELVIDPVLEYSTYLGGSGQDGGISIVADSAGNAYVTGYTGSSDFPTTSGAFQTTLQTIPLRFNAFVTKLNPAGTALLYSTYLGGSLGDSPNALAVDGSGNAYVTGTANSEDFPVTSGAFQTVNNGASNFASNAFITKLNATGTGLIYSTFLGGSGYLNPIDIGSGDSAYSIALDSSGNAYVAGTTYSTNFPTTPGAFQTTNNAASTQNSNGFIAKLNSAGSALLYSTYLGGSGVLSYEGDGATGLAAGADGNAYVTGYAASTNFPVTSGAFLTTNPAAAPGEFSSSLGAFVAKLNPQGAGLLYSTYLGAITGTTTLAVDASGDAYVAGATTSIGYPVTNGAFQITLKGIQNGFVTKLNPTGSGLVYSTYLGGNNFDQVRSLVLDPAGDAYLAGSTGSSNFPVTSDAFQPVNNGFDPDVIFANAFMAELNPGGTGLVYSTYLGGGPIGDLFQFDGDQGSGIALDPSGNAYVAGTAASDDFPVTNGAFQISNHSPASNAFVAKFSLGATPGLTTTSTTVSADVNPQAEGSKVTFTASVAPTSGSGVPTGNVSFSVSGGTPIIVGLDKTGRASYATSTLPIGSNTLVVNYSGNSGYSASSGSLTETIAAPTTTTTTTTLTSSANPAAVGAPVTFTVFVQPISGSGIPTGTVAFSVDGGADIVETLDGTAHASYSVSTLTVGQHTITAVYSGDANYSASTGMMTEIISESLQFVPAKPCRVADTRNPDGTFGGPGLGAGASREFDIPQSACNIPSTAVAYSLNVTVVPNASLDYLTLWPSGQPQPYVSTLNSDGRVKAGAAITPAGVNGGVSVFVTDASQVILDIDGYFAPAGTASAFAFYPVTPCRIADTRNAAGPLGGPYLAGNTSRNFPIQSSSCGLPSTAQAYSLNVTAVPHSTLNYLTTWPTGETQPYVSTLNSSTGAVTANAAIVQAGNGGDVSIYVYDDADVILDVNGYFAPPSAGGLSLYTVAPCRVIDTRPMAFYGFLLPIGVEASACAPPSTAQAYVLNATVVPVVSLNYLTLWPDGGSQPYVSTLNADDGATTSNMAIVPTNNGSIDAFAYGGTNLILDISSYFAP